MDKAKDWFIKYMPRNGNCCSFYVEHSSGVSEYSNTICHASAQPASVRARFNNGAKTLLSIGSCLPRSVGTHRYDGTTTTDEASIRYYDFLFDKDRSPYRKAFKDLEVIKDDDGNYLGFSLNDLSVPGNLLLSLLIASRTPWERVDKCDNFSQFLDAGFKDTEAWYLSQTTSNVHNRDKTKFSCEYGSGHACVYGRTYGAYGRNGCEPHSLTSMNTGEYDYSRCSNGKKNYNELQGYDYFGQFYRMFEGKEINVNHPFLLNYEKVETFVYTGRFGKLAKLQTDFPVPLKQEGKDEIILTIEQLKEHRKEWSPL